MAADGGPATPIDALTMAGGILPGNTAAPVASTEQEQREVAATVAAVRSAIGDPPPRLMDTGMTFATQQHEVMKRAQAPKPPPPIDTAAGKRLMDVLQLLVDVEGIAQSPQVVELVHRSLVSVKMAICVSAGVNVDT